MESYRIPGSPDSRLQGGYGQHTHPPGAQGDGAGSFGVKVQVQGIDGHPFVVLNNQGRNSHPHAYPDVFFMEHHQEHIWNARGRDPRSHSPSVELRSQRQTTSSSSPTELRGSQKKPSSPLLNYQRHPELLQPYDPENNSLDLDAYCSHTTLTASLSAVGRIHERSSSQTTSSLAVNKARIPLPAADLGRAQYLLQTQGPTAESIPSNPSPISHRPPEPGIETNPIPSVGSLIDRFDGQTGPQRSGRVGRRSRPGSEERKRSRSTESSTSPEPSSASSTFSGVKGDKVGGASAPGSPLCRAFGGEASATGQGRAEMMERAEVRSTAAMLKGQRDVGVKCPRTARVLYRVERTTLSKTIHHNGAEPSSEREAQVTPDLLKGQRELLEEPDEDTAKLVLFNYLKDGSTDSDDITRRKVNLMFEKIHMLRSMAAENVEEFQFPDSMATVKELRENKAGLESKITELKKQLEKETNSGQSEAEACERTGADMRRLQEELRRSEQEQTKLRQRLTDMEKELQANLEKLLQVRREREQQRAEIRDLQHQLSEMHNELDNTNKTAAGEKEAILQDLAKLRLDLQELQQQEEEKEEALRWKERELTALRGALEEEVSAHATDVDMLKEQHEQEAQELRQAVEEAKESSLALGREKAEVEAERGEARAEVGELTQERELLSGQVEELESRVTQLNHIIKGAKTQEDHLRGRKDQLEEERQQLEAELAEVRQQEEDLCGANRALTIHLEDTQCELTKLNHDHRELKERLKEESSQVEELRRKRSEMEEERRQRDRVMEQLQDEMSAVVEEAERATHRLQVQIDEARERSLRELTELHTQLQDKAEELEKHTHAAQTLQKELSLLEAELKRSESELEEAELQCKQLEQRVEELQDEIRATQDDRDKQVKLMEVRISRLEQDLSEECSSGDLLLQRVEKAKGQMEQARTDLLQERATRQDLECDKISLERQNKDLKSRVAHLEGSQKASQNSLLSKLEGRIQELEERLRGEERDNSNLQQANRKLERKVKEMMIQVDEEQRSLQSQRDQLILRLKALKRQLDEAEGEIERLENSKRKLQRELDDLQETNDQLQSQLTALRTEMRRKKKPTPLLKTLDEDEDEEYYVSPD